jgi:TonB family protein
LQLGPEVSARRTHLSLRVRLDPDGDDLVPTVETMRAGPAVLSLKPARYPKSALRRRVSALILAHFDVTPAGEVTELRIEGDHDGLFRAAVEEALHAWRFAPESRGGTPVASPMCVPFRFTIVGAKAESPEHDALHCPEQPRGVRAPGQRPGFDEIEISARRGR